MNRSRSIHIDEWRKSHQPGAGNYGPSAAYRVQSYIRMPSVNTRHHKLWRPDNRYPGWVAVRRHESGGVELSFDALRHGAKPRKPIVIDSDDVDAFILSLLEVRQRNKDEGQECDDIL